MDQKDITEIEQIIGYHFFEKQHLIRALTHPAYANELLQQNKRCMDQMAYSTLGDAVLKTGMILFLMEKGIQSKGQITQEKERLEDNPTLAKVAQRLRIRKFIRLGRGEKGLWRDGEETILADTMEALGIPRGSYVVKRQDQVRQASLGDGSRHPEDRRRSLVLRDDLAAVLLHRSPLRTLKAVPKVAKPATSDGSGL